MKKNFVAMLVLTTATSLLADRALPTGSETPASTAPLISEPVPSTPSSAPATSSTVPAAQTTPPPVDAKALRQPVQRRPAIPLAEMRTVPLVPGPAVVTTVNPNSRVNVRGQAKLNSEIITRLTNGEPVSVIEEVQLRRSGPDEPSAWAKILLPEKANPWVNAAYIDPATKAVTAKTKLNLRGGPGENYSILGTLQPGQTVKEIQTKDGWIQIESAQGAFAFVAAPYLRQDPAIVLSQPSPTEPPPAEATVTETPVVAATVTDATQAVPPPAEPPMEPAPEEIPAIEEPPPIRIVQRQGLVRGATSIQSPTSFELVSPESRRTINYLHTTSTNLDLSRYKGLNIIVTGEEGLDERWRNTPVISIQRIQVLD